MILLKVLLMLTISNIFMTYAWYGHLKDLAQKPLYLAIVLSWGVAFFEYCFQVPANRIGFEALTLPQLKIIQEVLTMVVFMGFALIYMDIKPTWNFLWASLCLMGAVFFIFKDHPIS